MTTPGLLAQVRVAVQCIENNQPVQGITILARAHRTQVASTRVTVPVASMAPHASPASLADRWRPKLMQLKL